MCVCVCVCLYHVLKMCLKSMWVCKLETCKNVVGLYMLM